LALGLPLFALIFSLAIAALLAIRRVENEALTFAAGGMPAPLATLANETARR
jgi:hypothetical protein